jgi:hypothetical protein
MSRKSYKRYLAAVDECIAAAREGIALRRAKLKGMAPKGNEAARDRLAWSEDALRQMLGTRAPGSSTGTDRRPGDPLQLLIVRPHPPKMRWTGRGPAA